MSLSGESFALELQMPDATAWVSDYSGTPAVPALTVSADNVYWSAAVALPQIQADGPTSFGWDVSVSLPMLEAGAVADTGRFGTAAISVPNIKAAGNGKRAAQASVSLPQLTISAQAHHVIDWGSPAVEAPMPLLTAQVVRALAATYQAWCLNARTLGASEYTSYSVSSFMRFGGKTYATLSGGVYELTGGTDAGSAISAAVLGGSEDYGSDDPRFDSSSLQKRSAGIYFNVRGNGSMLVHVVVDENTERFYTVDLSADPNGVHQRRIQPGRLLEGRNWQVGMKNVSGADFTLRDYYNTPIILSRRI